MHLSKQGSEFGVSEVLFSVVPGKVVYLFIFFPFFFQIHRWIVYIWPIYDSFDQMIWFTFQRELLNKLSFLSSQLLLLSDELQKCTPTILMENCDQTICLGLSILFLNATPHKVWLSEKFTFELKCFSHDNFNILFW